jgi:hypothetical protein
MVDVSEFGKGAIRDSIDKRDYKFTENFTAVALPDTFSVRDKIQTLRNQNGSGSCGGQAFGYHMETNTFLRDGKFTPLSSKSIYQPVFVSPEGSNARDLLNRIDSVGVCLESDVPSYDNGNPPSEAFMEDGSKITAAMLVTAKQYSGKTYLTFDSTDLSQVKQAIFQGNGAVIAVVGNNPCWTTSNGEITVPGVNTTTWGHFIFLTGWVVRNGERFFEFVNSWGKEWGDNGFGYLPEAYLTSGFGYNEWVVIENPLPDTNFHHQFNVNLTYGENSDEVKSLQTILVKMGYNTLITGLYGEMTRKAVLKFQYDNKVDNPIILWLLQGKQVGPKTRLILSKI